VRLNLVGPFVVNAPFGTEIAFAKGLRRAGHIVFEIDPNILGDSDRLDPDADATVVFKSCVGREAEIIGGLKHPVVTYQPDDARFAHIREMMLMMRRYSDLFLSFDDYGADLAKTMGYRAAETLLLTADDELYCPSPEPVERDIDISFIGSLGDPVAHASRRRMLEVAKELADQNGWKTAFGTTQDMLTILAVYRRSKVVLNHATDVGQPFGSGFGLQCRHFEVSMTRTCLLSNVAHGKTWSPAFTTEAGLRHSLISLLTGEDGDLSSEHFGKPLWQKWAEINYQWVQNNRPEHRAQQLADFIVRNKK